MILKSAITIKMMELAIDKLFSSVEKNILPFNGIKAGDKFSSITFIYNRYTSNPFTVYKIVYHDCTISKCNKGTIEFRHEKLNSYNVFGSNISYMNNCGSSIIYPMDIDRVESFVI